MNLYTIMLSAFHAMSFHATCDDDRRTSPARFLAAIRTFDKIYTEWKLKVEETQGFKI